VCLQAYDAHVSAEFLKLQTVLISQTELTRTFFDKLVSQLQKGMADMSDEYRAAPARALVMDVTSD
jgi:uncharacterized protein (DUF2461 family)